MPAPAWGCACYLPCAAWLWPDQEPEEAHLLQLPPSQNLAEALIPPAQASLGEHSHGTSQSGGSRPPGSRPPGSRGRAARQQHKARSGSAGAPHGEGIELKPAASNLMLGQAHLQSGGRFVQAQPGRAPQPARLQEAGQ